MHAWTRHVLRCLLAAAIFWGTALSPSRGSACPERPTPVIFIPGVQSSGMPYYYLWEQFAAQGFPAERMYTFVPPRTGTGDFYSGGTKWAWYTIYGLDYSRRNWDASGNTALNVPALKIAVDELLTSTRASQVDLVGHSNGSAIVRQLLQDPAYVPKVRKVVMISGFANVSDPNMAIDTPVRYLHDVAPDLPEGPTYHSISSEMDANMATCNWLYYADGAGPQNGLPWPFTNTMSALASGVGTNFQVWNADHKQILTRWDTFATLFRLLTGEDAHRRPPVRGRVTIGGRIVSEYDDVPYDSAVRPAYMAPFTEGGVVIVKYYDPGTGLETGVGGASAIERATGQWRVPHLDPGRHLKIVVRSSVESQELDRHPAESHHFLADRIVRDNLNLFFFAPRRISSNNEKGSVAVQFESLHAYLSRDPKTVTGGGYSVTRPGDTFTATVSVGLEGPVSEVSTADVLLGGEPGSQSTFAIQNFTGNDFDRAPKAHRFDEQLYADRLIVVTHDLNGAGERKVAFSSDDRHLNRRHFVMYLEPPEDRRPAP